MAGYIARRLVLLPVVAFGVTVLIFALLQFLDPAIRAGAFITNPNQLKAIDAIIRKYGLDQPVYVQYWTWLREVFTGNLGWSQAARMPVGEAILRFFPPTLELTLFAFVPIMLMGVWMGTAAAVHRDRLIDHVTRVFSISFRSLPSFVWGLLVLMVTYGRLNWFPPGRLSLEADLFVRNPEHRFVAYTGLMTVDALLNGQLWIFVDAIRHLAGPALTLTMVSIALLVRVMRSSMLEVLNQDYVRTARSKGVAEPVVITRHARKNALIPVITLSSLTIVGLLGGVVITETIFNFPGIGRWGAFAAQQLDIPGVTGFTMFVAAITVLGNLLADVLYAYFDPRIRLQ
ncbi:MAG: ABC transporter permease [Armatimonadota bacterium]|nr:ABC transporter permease [Armatimonadota bacterium]